MKIMISHIPNTFNYGSAMMAINLIYYLDRKFNGDVNFYVDTRTEEDFGNLINSIGLDNIKVNKILPDKSKLIKAKKDVNLDLNWIGAYCDGIINNYDCFMVLGGDDLSEYYSKEHVVYELFKINRIASKIPVFLIGQTIGPFTEWRKEYAADMLKPCHIFTRDNLTYDYLTRELGISNVINSSDLAFLDLPNQNEYDIQSLLKKFNLNKGEYVTLVPSGSIKLYTNNYDNYIDNWVDIIEYLINNRGFKVTLLPHVLRPEHASEKVVIEDIMRRMGSKYPKELIYIDDILFPLGARLVLGNGLFSISGRMHGAVSTFQMEKPSISLSYSVKYKGVIGQGLDCEDLIVEASNDQKWVDGKVMTETINKIDYLINNYDDIVLKIKDNLGKCKDEVINMIDQIYREIGE